MELKRKRVDNAIIPNKPKTIRLGNRNFTIIKQLGNGTFGSVYHLKNPMDNKEYACKFFRIDEEGKKQSRHLRMAFREISILRTFSKHPNILSVLNYYVEYGKDHAILMELMNGDLYKLMYKLTISERIRLFPYITKNITESLISLHKEGIIHRDIKGPNILFSKKENDYCFKLADFGLSKRIRMKDYSVYVGTIGYQAPELWNITTFTNSDSKSEKHTHLSRYYDHTIDIWSLGIVLLEFLLGDLLIKKDKYKQLYEIFYKWFKLPNIKDIIEIYNIKSNITFSKKNLEYLGIEQSIEEKIGKENKSLIPLEYINLLKRMLMYHPSDRITTNEILCHPCIITIGQENEKQNKKEEGEEKELSVIYDYSPNYSEYDQHYNWGKFLQMDSKSIIGIPIYIKEICTSLKYSIETYMQSMDILNGFMCFQLTTHSSKINTNDLIRIILGSIILSSLLSDCYSDPLEEVLNTQSEKGPITFWNKEQLSNIVLRIFLALNGKLTKSHLDIDMSKTNRESPTMDTLCQMYKQMFEKMYE